MQTPYRITIVIEGRNVSVWVIEDDGGFWVAPDDWLPEPDGKSKRPRRIISLATGVDRRPMGRNGLDAIRDNIVQASLLFRGQGRVGEERLFLVREAPNILVPVGEIP
jgi:hypothetical protein